MARSATTSECTRKEKPEGRSVWLPGRGRTFVHQFSGPRGTPTLLLLHGLNSTADLNWSSSFAALATHFNVIALDHRGHGRGIRRDTPFRLADCADDAAALVRRPRMREGDPRRLLDGRSDRSAVLPPSPRPGQRRRALRDELPVPRDVPRGRAVLARRRRSTLAGALPLAEADHGRGRRVEPSQRVARPEVTEVRADRPPRLEPLVEARRELGRFDSRSWIREVGVPAALVMTDLDTVVPPDRQLLLVDRLRDLTVVHVDGGHGVCGADPAKFVPALLDACLTVAGASVRMAA